MRACCTTTANGHSEWRRERGVRMCTVILHWALITTLRQRRTFSLSFLWVGGGHLPLCCNGKICWSISQTHENLLWLHLRDVHCQDVPLHQVPSAKRFPALNPKIILLYYTFFLHSTGHPSPAIAIAQPHGLHEEDMALAMGRTGQFPGDEHALPCLNPSASLSISASGHGFHTKQIAVLLWQRREDNLTPPLLSSGLTSACATTCGWPCHSSYAFLSIRVN